MNKIYAILIMTSLLTLPFLNINSFSEAQVNAPPLEQSKVVKKWMLIGGNKREDIKDVSSLTYSGYELTFTYVQYYLRYRPYVVYNNVVYDLEDIIGIFPNILSNIEVERPAFSWKYSLNITDIPLALQQKIQAVGFKRVSTNLEWSDFELRKEGYYIDSGVGEFRDTYYIIVKDRVMFSFNDLLDSGFQVYVNRTDILIDNIAPNIVDNTLLLDPTIELQEADSENLADTFVDSNNNSTNYGTLTDMRIRNVTELGGYAIFRSYNMFDLSSVIDLVGFIEITDAQYILNHTTRGNPPPPLDRNVTTHFVNNTVWSETAITFGNQPCGDTKYSLNASCNETPSDWELVTGAGGLNIDYQWDVTSIVQNYNTSDSRITIGVFTDIGDGVGQDGYKGFATKEFADAFDRPLLNVTYTVGVFITAIFLNGISSMAANSTDLPNNTATVYPNNTIAVFDSNISSNFNFFRYELPESEDNHTHFSTYTRSITSNYTITAYALQTGGGGTAGVSMLLIAVVGGFAIIVLIVALRKK